MMEGLPSGLVNYNQPVRCVHWNATEKRNHPVTIECNNGEMMTADHVIVTVPLGGFGRFALSNCTSQSVQDSV